MKYTTLPAGYRLTVNSWENDGDASATKIVAGLTRTQVKYYLEFLKLLENDSEYSNMFDPTFEQIAAFHAEFVQIAKKYSAELVEACAPTGQHQVHAAVVKLNEMLLGWGSEGFYTRVFESFKVEYFPEEILIQDVTEEFNNG